MLSTAQVVTNLANANLFDESWGPAIVREGQANVFQLRLWQSDVKQRYIPNGGPGGVATQLVPASSGLMLPQGVINVLSTDGFPPNGNMLVSTSQGPQRVSYTGVIADTLAASTIAAATNGLTVQGAPTIYVASTSGFPASGSLIVAVTPPAAPSGFCGWYEWWGPDWWAGFPGVYPVYGGGYTGDLAHPRPRPFLNPLGPYAVLVTYTNALAANPVSTVSVGSNAQVVPVSAGTIHVVSTVGFPTAGTATVPSTTTTQTFTYTGLTATSFVGVSGGDGTGTMSTGGAVTSITQTSPALSAPYQPAFQGVIGNSGASTLVTGAPVNTAPQFTGCTGGSGQLILGAPVTIGVTLSIKFPRGWSVGSSTSQVPSYDQSINVSATQPIPGDSSIWQVSLTEQQSRIVTSGGAQLTLTEGQQTTVLYIPYLIRKQPNRGE